MKKNTLLSIIVEDDECIAMQIGRVIRFVLKQQYRRHAAIEEKGSGIYDVVVNCSSDEFAMLQASAIPFLQHVLVLAVRAQGWPFDVWRPHAKQKVMVNIWGGVHYLLRQIQSDWVGGTRVIVCSSDGSKEYAVWVGGPFQTNPSIERAYCYGSVIEADVAHGMSYVGFRDIGSGKRRFLVEDPGWSDRSMGKTIFVTLTRYRGKSGCWKLCEWFEPDAFLSDEWPITIRTLDETTVSSISMRRPSIRRCIAEVHQHELWKAK